MGGWGEGAAPLPSPVGAVYLRMTNGSEAEACGNETQSKKNNSVWLRMGSSSLHVYMAFVCLKNQPLLFASQTRPSRSRRAQELYRQLLDPGFCRNWAGNKEQMNEPKFSLYRFSPSSTNGGVTKALICFITTQCLINE